MSMKSSDDTLGNRTRDLPTCSTMHRGKKWYIINESYKRFKFNSLSETKLGNGNVGEADYRKKTTHLETLKVKSRGGVSGRCV